MTTPAQLRVEVGEPSLTGVRGTIGQLAILASSEGLLRLGNFALAVVIARTYSPATLGVYAMAVAASTCAVTFADGGLQLSAIRWISSAPFNRNAIFSRVFLSKLLILPVAVLVAAGILSGDRVGTLWAACALVFLRTLLQSFAQLNYAVLKALRSVPPIAALQYIHFGLVTGILVAAIWFGLHFITLLTLLVGSQAVEFGGSAYWLLVRRRLRFEATSWSDCIRLIRASVPTGITTSISTIVLRADLIVLALFVTVEKTGQYAAAQFVMVAMYLAAWLFGSLVLPDFSGKLGESAAVRSTFKRWTVVITATALPVTAALIWIVPNAVRQLFGSDYQESARLVAVLLLATPFIWLNSLYLHRAIAFEEKRIHVHAYALVTGIAAVVSVAVVWRLGAIGVAAIAVGREAALFAVLFAMTAGRQ